MRAPARIDFGGGWTDVPPYAEEVGGFVCSVAISRYATVRVRACPDTDAFACAPVVADSADIEGTLVEAVCRHLNVRDLEVALTNNFPVGAGLGGSSAGAVAAIAAIAAWRRSGVDLNILAETSRAIETGELGIPGGRQDHYAAAYGGALALRFGVGVDVRPIPLNAAVRDELARRCLIIYSGQSRISGDTITAVLTAYREGNRGVVSALRRMREVAEQMPRALEDADFDALGELVTEQWAHQRSLHSTISTARIDAIIERARAAGATGAKALGASGGGCVLAIAGQDRVAAVRKAIAPLGELLEFTVDTAGVCRCD